MKNRAERMGGGLLDYHCFMALPMTYMVCYESSVVSDRHVQVTDWKVWFGCSDSELTRVENE